MVKQQSSKINKVTFLPEQYSTPSQLYIAYTYKLYTYKPSNEHRSIWINRYEINFSIDEQVQSTVQWYKYVYVCICTHLLKHTNLINGAHIVSWARAFLKYQVEQLEKVNGLLKVEAVSVPGETAMMYWSLELHPFPVPSCWAPRLQTK